MYLPVIFGKYNLFLLLVVAKETDGVPDSYPAYGNDREEDDEDVVVVDADGVGIDDEAA